MQGHGRIALLVASLVASAYFMALAIGLPGQSWLAWVTLPPLFLAIRSFAPLRAMLCGGLWGGCLFAFSIFSIETPIAPTIGSLALLTFIPAVYAFCGALLTRGIGYSALFLALGWIGVEAALKPLALQNGLLAGTQGDGVLVHLVGGLFGYGLVAFVIAFANGLLLTILSDLRFNLVWPSLLVGLDKPAPLYLLLTSPYFLSNNVCSAHPRAPPDVR